MRFDLILLLLSIVSGVKNALPKYCVNCRYFIDTPTTDYNPHVSIGRCSFFPKKNVNHLITGKESDKEFFYATTAREFPDMCGEEGKQYKKKYKPRSKETETGK